MPARTQRQVGFFGLAQFQQLGDTEIEHPDLAFTGNEYVGRLQVAMQHERAMGERDCRGDLKEEFEPRVDGRLRSRQYSSMRLPSTYSSTRYGCPIGRRSGIEQARNIRMIERIQNVALPREPFAEQTISPASSRKFHRYRPGRQAIGALCDPDFGHSALADFFNQTPAPIVAAVNTLDRFVAVQRRRVGQQGAEHGSQFPVLVAEDW